MYTHKQAVSLTLGRQVSDCYAKQTGHSKFHLSRWHQAQSKISNMESAGVYRGDIPSEGQKLGENMALVGWCEDFFFPQEVCMNVCVCVSS